MKCVCVGGEYNFVGWGERGIIIQRGQKGEKRYVYLRISSITNLFGDNSGYCWEECQDRSFQNKQRPDRQAFGKSYYESGLYAEGIWEYF